MNLLNKSNNNKKTSSIKKKNPIGGMLCNNMLMKKNKTLELYCKKTVTKLKDKKFRKKLMIGSVMFVLFNLAIILLLSRKTLVYKLTKYFAKKILEGASSEEKELISQIQTNLPLVVDFVNKHSDKIKQIDNTYTYYNDMYNSFTTYMDVSPDIINYNMPGGFPEENKNEDKISPPLPDKKLDESQAKELIDDLIEESTSSIVFKYFLNMTW